MCYKKRTDALPSAQLAASRPITDLPFFRHRVHHIYRSLSRRDYQLSWSWFFCGFFYIPYLNLGRYYTTTTATYTEGERNGKGQAQGSSLCLVSAKIPKFALKSASSVLKSTKLDRGCHVITQKGNISVFAPSSCIFVSVKFLYLLDTNRGREVR